jgi:hypothetical protein
LTIVPAVTGNKINFGSRQFKWSEFRLTAKFSEGSLEGFIDYTETMLDVIKMLPGTYQLALFGGAIFTYFSFSKYLQYKENLIKIEANSKSVLKDKDIVSQALDIASKALTAPKFLQSQLRDEDFIETPEGDIDKKKRKIIYPQQFRKNL